MRDRESVSSDGEDPIHQREVCFRGRSDGGEREWNAGLDGKLDHAPITRLNLLGRWGVLDDLEDACAGRTHHPDERRYLVPSCEA